MTIIWATRGRDWGFTFLRRGGIQDPLAPYEKVFSAMDAAPTACRRLAGAVGVRFPDPLGRRDGAGRLIPHEFVLTDEDAVAVTSVDDAVRIVWSQVADEYAQVWDAPQLPAPFD
ncbi:hypothetical protein [Propionibacterium australiense]|uniref:Uncharacterized protein n=1 Tax=Propionibacterium australiense TaxID=119981 RepID=A0A8B3FVX8_9ACTN|nr:hypothetical protein [Propionibacterium australiense]RLP10990.1 hypothetical protein D9T14_04415 [Propionibacterium australiense]RLP13044.1 hypothetical protein D7U36_01045 [Propionibacterium australiense]VEH90976.1 Uncharacterised protein [Propionibacterium australiense]